MGMEDSRRISSRVFGAFSFSFFFFLFTNFYYRYTTIITRHHPLSLANATWGGFFFTQDGHVAPPHTTNPTASPASPAATAVDAAAAAVAVATAADAAVAAVAVS
jgi:hypothetical protein